MKHFVQGILMLFIYSCAQVVAPSGGEQDTTPPKIVESNPINYSTNFSGTVISLKFDEFVKNRGLEQNVLISPPLDEPPIFNIKGKELIIEFNQPLLKNTTYHINLGNGLVDLHESNPLDSNQIIFSTGEFLDSLEINGNIIDAFSLKPIKDAWVMLYKNLEDSVPCKQKPGYLAKVNAEGNYFLKHLAEGEYQLVGLVDQNSNYLFDLPNESFAFNPTVVDASIDTSYNLKLYQEEVLKVFVSQFKQLDNKRLIVAFNKPFEDFALVDMDNVFKKKWYSEFINDEKDSVEIWLDEIGEIDSLNLQVLFNQEILDTLRFKLDEIPDDEKKRRKYFRLRNLKLSANTQKGKLKYSDTLQINSNLYISSIDKKRMLLQKDSTDLEFEFLENSKKEFQVVYPWEKEIKYSLTLFDSALTNIYGRKSDSVQIKFEISSKEDYGDLWVKPISDDFTQSMILQLIGKKNKVLKETAFSPNDSVLFEALEPTKYGLKLIWDSNSNKRWDTGNYGEKRQPEKVIFYNGKIDVKSSWDNKIDWIIE